MPVVTRQHPSGSEANGKVGNVLARIKQVQATNIGRLKVSLYGMPKTGKTRLACSFPKPLLIVGAEDGTASVAGSKGVEFVRLTACDEFRELVEGPISKGRWATVVLDTATKFREMRVKEIFAAMGMEVPERKPFMYADKIWKQVWVQCSQDMRDALTGFLDIPGKRDLNVVVIAQEQNFSDEENTGDIVRPAIGSALGKSLCMFLNAECDYVCQTFIRQQVQDRKTVVNKKEVIHKVQTGRKEFCLRVGPHETYITGFRLPEGRTDLPEVIVDPHYDKVKALIEGKLKQ